MKAKRLIVLSAGLLMLGGCATTQSPMTEGPSQSYYDERYVGTVNHLARKMGTRVIWVNPPRPSSRVDSDG